MRKLTALLLCMQFGLVVAANNILAIVNNSVITMASVEQQLETANSFDEKMAIINQQIDALLIQEQIIKLGISPTKQTIDLAIEQVATSNNLTVEELKFNPEFPILLQQISNQLSVNLLQQRVADEVVINLTDAEIKTNCPNSVAGSNTKQIKIAQLIISEIENAKDQEIAAKEFLGKITRHVEKGASFYNFAKLHSQHMSYAQGGLSDWLTVEGSNLELFDNLNEGQVSKIYNFGSGWAIAIKVHERYINSNLEACKQQIINNKALKHFVKWVQKLRAPAYIEIYSEKLAG